MFSFILKKLRFKSRKQTDPCRKHFKDQNGNKKKKKKEQCQILENKRKFLKEAFQKTNWKKWEIPDWMISGVALIIIHK